MTTLRVELPPKLIPVFAPARGELRYRAMRGGRGSGKSFTAAKMAAIWGACEPLRFLCTRELQNSIKESFHAELKNAIASCEWLSGQYDVGADYLRHKHNGTEFLFKGLRHNITAVKSMAQIDVLIVEEAETVPHASWVDLIPTIRAPKSEIWVIWNPKSPTSWVAERFDKGSPPPRSIVATVNHSDNPWFSKELEEERADNKLTMPVNLYNHIWEGAYLLDDEASIIKSSWIEAAVDAHLLVPEIALGSFTMGYDIADDGADKCATVTRQGGMAFDCDEWAGKEDELLKSTTRAHHTAVKYGAHVNYDCIGVGASAGAYFKELNDKLPSTSRITYAKFNAGGAVIKPEAIYQSKSKIKNKDFFSGLKSQAWWLVADRFRLTYQVVTALKEGKQPPSYTPDQLISISSKMPKLDQLKMELCVPMRDFDNNGRVKVESKKDLAKREVPSPNMADAFIMAYAPMTSGLKINPGLLR